MQVMILGTYHFANPNLDVVKTEVADVLTPRKQEEIAGVVERLARFAPTKVAVEELPRNAARLDSLYRAYLAGVHQPSRNETEQLGFRVAGRLAHARVHPIDHRGPFPFGPVMSYAQQHQPSFVQRFQQAFAHIESTHNEWQRTKTVGEILTSFNDPDYIAEGHGLYLEIAAVGAGDSFVGADLLSAWYDRNIRIFSNLQRIAEPGDRILVVIGQGHAAILRELVRSSPGWELVEPNQFLAPPNPTAPPASRN